MASPRACFASRGVGGFKNGDGVDRVWESLSMGEKRDAAEREGAQPPLGRGGSEKGRETRGARGRGNLRELVRLGRARSRWHAGGMMT
jgi:hypothetical protein